MKNLFILSFLLNLIRYDILAQCPADYTGLLTVHINRTSDGSADQTFVGFNPYSTDSFNACYDANKNFGALNRPTLFTINSGQWMAINIMNSVATVPTVPMGLEPGGSSNFFMTFTIADFSPTTYIYVQDSQVDNYWFNARSGNYLFYADSTENWNRFVIHFTPPAIVTTSPATCTNEGAINITQPGPAYWNYVLADSGNNATVSTGKLNVNTPIHLNEPAGSYILTLTDTSGYVAKDTIRVAGEATAAASFTMSSTNVCVQSAVSFTNTSQNVATYSWNFGDGATTTSVANPTHTYTATGTYKVILAITTSSGCSGADTQTVVVSSGLSVHLGNDTTLCSGDTVKLNATVNGATYSWNTGATTALLTVTAAGQYSVTVTSGSCSGKDTVQVSYQAKPVISLGNDTTICSPATVVLNAGNAGATYQWQNNSTGGTYTVNTSGTYSVTVTKNGCSASSSTEVSVNAPPTVNLGNDTSVCSPATVVLNAGNAGATYRWQNNSTASTFTVNATGTYSVTVTVNVCSGSDSVKVTVNAAPTTAPSATSSAICNGQSTTLAANATAGSGTISAYAWSGGLAGSVSGGSVSPASNTTYTVTVTNSNSCKATGTVSVSVNARPTVNPVATSASICNGQSSTLHTNGNAGSGTLSAYTWSNGVNGGLADSSISVSPATTTTYDVTVTNSNSCSVTGAVVVTVVSNLSVNPVATSSTICNGKSSTLHANGNAGSGAGYSWSNGVSGGLADSSISVSPGITTTYNVTVTNSNSCSATGSVTVNVNANPTINPVASSATICSGQSSTLHTNGNAGSGTLSAYSWSNGVNGGLADSSISVSPASTTTYDVTITNSNSCSVTGAVAVTVVSNLSVNPVATSSTICNGQSSTLHANGNAGSGAGYSWSNGVSGGLADSSISVSPGTTTTYNVTVTNSNSCSATGSVTVNVNAHPTINPIATSDTICSGQSSTLHTNGNAGSGTLSTYSWSNGVNGGLADSSISVSPTSTTTYKVTVTNSNSCSVTGSVAVTVATVTVAPTATPDTICIGQSTTLAANATGGGVLVYAWTGPVDQEGGPVEPITNSTYSVTVTNQNSCTATGAVTVNVNGNPTATPSVTSGTICNGQTTTLAANATAGSGTISNYAWSGGIPGNNSGGSVSPTSNTTYTVTVTNSNSCTVTGTVSVNVNAAPTAAPSAISSAICSGQSTILTANATAGSGTIFSYSWSNGFLNGGGSVSPISNTTYTVTVTNSNSCTVSGAVTVNVNANPTTAPTATAGTICSGQSTTLAANATAGSGTISNYAWSSGLGNVSGGNVSPASDTTYTVTVTNSNSCTVTGTVSVNVNAIPTAAPSISTASICNGVSDTIAANATAGSGAITAYAWSNGLAGSVPGGTVSPASNTTYIVTVTNSNSCTAAGTVSVNVNAAPTAAPGATSGAICNGQSDTLAANATAGSGTISTYAWSGGLAGNFPNGIISPISNTTYIVTVTNSNSCSATGSVSVNVNAVPIITPSATQGTICDGESDMLAANATSGSGTISTYEWSNGLGNVSGGSVSPVSNITYTVTVTNSNSCSATGTVSVNVNTAPVVNLGNDTSVCAPHEIILTATTPGGSYLWQDNSSAGTYTVNSTGTYSVTVTANGCSGSGSVQVTVKTPPAVNLGNDTSVCSNDTVILNAANAGATYLWQDNSTASAYIVTTTGNYNVTVSANGCFTTAGVQVTVAAHLVVNLGSDTSVCSPDSVILVANPSGAVYQWQNNSTSRTYVVNSTGTYTVSVTTNGCSGSGSVTVKVNNRPVDSITSNSMTLCSGQDSVSVCSRQVFNAYQWNSGQNTACANFLNGGLYFVVVTDNNNCTAASNTVTITAIAPPTASINASADSICPYATDTICTSGSFATYLWSNGQSGSCLNTSNAGSYHVKVSDNYGCTGLSNSVLVGVYPLPTPMITTNIDTVCTGDTAHLCTTQAFVSYNWNDQNGLTQCIKAANAGDYYLTVTDNNGCSAESNHITLNVRQTLPVSTSQSGDTLEVYHGVNYQWLINGNPISGANSDIYVFHNSGTYSVQVTDSNGCLSTSAGIFVTGIINPGADSDSYRNLKVYPNPSASGWQLSVTDNLIGAGLEIIDAQGRMVFEGKIENTHTNLNFDAAPGVYLMRINSSGNTINKILVKL